MLVGYHLACETGMESCTLQALALDFHQTAQVLKEECVILNSFKKNAYNFLLCNSDIIISS